MLILIALVFAGFLFSQVRFAEVMPAERPDPLFISLAVPQHS